MHAIPVEQLKVDDVLTRFARVEHTEDGRTLYTITAAAREHMPDDAFRVSCGQPVAIEGTLE